MTPDLDRLEALYAGRLEAITIEELTKRNRELTNALVYNGQALIFELRQARSRLAALEQAEDDGRSPQKAYAMGYTNGCQEGYDEARAEIERLKRIEAAARNVANTLNGGFIVCQHCGEQETTTDMDYAQDLYAALAPAPIAPDAVTDEQVHAAMAAYENQDADAYCPSFASMRAALMAALQPPDGDA